MHKMFVHEETGFVSIGDGTTEPVTFTIEQFLSEFPDYRLPEGVVGVNYEHQGNRLLYIVHRGMGHSQTYTAEDPVYEAHIARFAEYKAKHAEITHPLYGLSLEDQRRSLASSLSVKRLAEAGIISDAYSSVERETFRFQVEEAAAWAVDNSSPTPFLDASRKAGEEKADQVAAILKNDADYFSILASRLKIIREARAEVSVMDEKTVRATFDANFMGA